MAVTLSLMANGALSTDLLLNGTLTVAGAKKDGTESLAVTVYNKTTGATFATTAQVYDGASTVIYSYANGSTMSINFSTGVWVYQRINSEIGGTQYEYSFTFAWTDLNKEQSNVLNVVAKENVIINSFKADSLDDLDKSLKGTFDVTITKLSGVSISVVMTANNTTLTGTAQTLSTTSDKLSWTFLDETVLTVDLGNKTFEYVRKASEVGDKKSDSYNLSITIGGVSGQVCVLSTVGFPPTVRTFSCNKASDTEGTITGSLSIDNIVDGTTLNVNMTHNGVLYSAASIVYADTMTWKYDDGTEFNLDASKNTWTYTRISDDTVNLQPDTYKFELNLANRYGNTTSSVAITTTVPIAQIVSFSADNISDGESTITGTLEYILPSVAYKPTMSINVSISGVVYSSDAVTITDSVMSFSYSNGARLVVNPANHTFAYTRASDEVNNNDVDNYVFELSITVNEQTITQNTSAQSMAGQRIYDYEPAYPVNVAPGSLERQNTAWPKYVMEIQRIYRQFNDNLNYYESLSNELKYMVYDARKWVEDRLWEQNNKLTEAVSKLSQLRIKAISGVAFHGETIPVPEGSDRNNCVCFVSLHHWTNTISDNKYTYDMYIWVNYPDWTLTCCTQTQGRDGTGGLYPGYANYLVIDCSTLYW